MPETGKLYSRIEMIIPVKRNEWPILFLSFIYHFSLLCSFYIIRPMRDEMGIAGGVERLQWMFSGTFIVMLAAVPLFGWITRNFPRRIFMPSVYIFFSICIFIFYILFRTGFSHAYIARAFFIWASVFNLFIVSVFWSFMSDILSTEQSKRLFGIIAAGGTAGALSGPALTALLVFKIGTVNLLPVSSCFLLVSVFCIWKLLNCREPGRTGSNTPGSLNEETLIGGSVFAGLKLIIRSPYLAGICLFMLLFTTLSTFIYFQQAYIIREKFSDPAERTAVFALMDFSVNLLTLVFQIFFTGRIVKNFGISLTLAAVPFSLIFGFIMLTIRPAAGILIPVQILRRAGEYSITRPAREMLYVVLDREEKYKAKNFIDTVIYRGGDALSSWIYAGLTAIGLSLSNISAAGIALAAVWAWLAYKIGMRYERIVQAGDSKNNEGGM